MKFLNRYNSAILALALLTVIAGVILGLKLPNSLLPDISRPQIELFTRWPGKTAAQIEQSLIAPLEQQLSGIAQMTELSSRIRAGSASTVLSFQADADMKQAYIDVLSSSSQVPNWPSQVAAPFIEDYSNGAGATLASFFVYHSDKAQTDPDALIDAYRFYIEPAFAKIPGIGGAVVGTPTERRIDIEFDPKLLAKHSLSQSQVLAKINNFTDRSGGDLDFGARQYSLQFKGQVSLDNLSQVAIAANGQQIIRLGDIAKIKTRLASDWGYFALEGKRSLYFYLQPSQNINVMQTIDQIKTTMTTLNDGPLGAAGIQVSISRDDSVAISSALWLVYGSLVLGIVLACVVLFYFLRHLGSVILVFLSIPFCLAAVAILMALNGYSLNVISLAGMALSIGLILDAAIIVVETINRIDAEEARTQDQNQNPAAGIGNSIERGINEVRAALLSSILSSIIVFLPMLFMESSEGRLFRDLAFTITAALAASALFALIVLPLLYRRFIKNEPSHAESYSEHSNYNAVQLKTQAKLPSLLVAPLYNRSLAIGVLITAIPVAVLASYFMRPAIDVLPDPKQNIISTFVSFDEPISVSAIAQEYAEPMVARIEKQLQHPNDLGIRTHGMFCFPTLCQIYFYTDGSKDFKDLKQWVETTITQDLIGTQVFSRQGGLLRFAMPDSRVSQIDIKGADLTTLQLAGRELLEHLKLKYPNARIDEGTPLNNRASRIEFTPKQDQLVYLGLSPHDLNQHLLALSGGVYLGDFYTGSNTLPFYFKAQDAEYLEQILNTEIVVSGHGLVPLRELTHAEIKLAPESIFRVNRELTASISISPPQGQAMGGFLKTIKPAIEAFMIKKHPGLHISFRGSADNLKVFLQEFIQIFIAALVILSLLMFLTLNSWKLAGAVLLSMPLAMFGGMLNLKILNLFTPQNLDIITMIGFIILMGLVINNAILLASRFRQGMNAGLQQTEAILLAIDARKRAIYMSTGTSILGMLPLMISPANSAEIYRGLAAVICGGMIFSALFSITFMSALLSLPFFNESMPLNKQNSSANLSTAL